MSTMYGCNSSRGEWKAALEYQNEIAISSRTPGENIVHVEIVFSLVQKTAVALNVEMQFHFQEDRFAWTDNKTA